MMLMIARTKLEGVSPGAKLAYFHWVGKCQRSLPWRGGFCPAKNSSIMWQKMLKNTIAVEINIRHNIMCTNTFDWHQCSLTPYSMQNIMPEMQLLTCLYTKATQITPLNALGMEACRPYHWMQTVKACSYCQSEAGRKWGLGLRTGFLMSSLPCKRMQLPCKLLFFIF